MYKQNYNFFLKPKESVPPRGNYARGYEPEVAETFKKGFHFGVFVISNYLQGSFPEECKQIRTPKTIQIRKLQNMSLRSCLDVIVEPDADGYIARVPVLNLYGYGDDIIESIDMLTYEIETLYEDLNSDDTFAEEWGATKRMLNDLIESNVG